jgi:hypothetical protein
VNVPMPNRIPPMHREAPAKQGRPTSSATICCRSGTLIIPENSNHDSRRPHTEALVQLCLNSLRAGAASRPERGASSDPSDSSLAKFPLIPFLGYRSTRGRSCARHEKTSMPGPRARSVAINTFN